MSKDNPYPKDHIWCGCPECPAECFCSHCKKEMTKDNSELLELYLSSMGDPYTQRIEELEKRVKELEFNLGFHARLLNEFNHRLPKELDAKPDI